MASREQATVLLMNDLERKVPAEHIVRVAGAIVDLPTNRRVNLAMDYLRLSSVVVQTLVSVEDNPDFERIYCQAEPTIDRTNLKKPTCIFNCQACDYSSKPRASDYPRFTDRELVGEIHIWELTLKPHNLSSNPEWGLELCAGGFKSCYNFAFIHCPGNRPFPSDIMTRFS